MAVPPFRCELEARWQATAGQDLMVGTSLRERVFNQPLADNWLTIGSGSRFPAVAPNREFPKDNEGQRSPAAPSCVGFFALGAGGRWFESSRPDHFPRVHSADIGNSLGPKPLETNSPQPETVGKPLCSLEQHSGRARRALDCFVRLSENV